jgi:hypothetical protein
MEEFRGFEGQRPSLLKRSYVGGGRKNGIDGKENVSAEPAWRGCFQVS